MRYIASRFACSGALLLALLFARASWAGGEIVEPAAGATSASWSYYVCRAGVAGIGGGRMPVTKKATWYFSAVMTGAPTDDVRNALSAFVTEKYGVPVASTECQTARDEASARKQVVDAWKPPSMAQYQDYVDTGWVYKPAAGTAAPAVAAETSKQATFACEGGASVVATYYFQPPRPTPIRVTATVNGNTTPLMHDRDDANGWDFASSDVWVSVSRASVHRGAQTIQCKLRGAPGVPALMANQSAPASAAAHPAAGSIAPAAPNAPKPAVASPPPATQATVYIICRADTSPGEPHFYNPPVNGTGGNYATWQSAYQSYLVEKHHFKGSGVGCGDYPTQAAARVDFDQWVANARHDSTISGLTFKVVVTDWKFQ